MIAWQLAASDVGLDGSPAGVYDVYNLVRNSTTIASVAIDSDVNINLNQFAFF
jgi:hypothetical protein